VTKHWTVAEEVQLEEGAKVLCFEKLEILYFSTKITYLGCNFPHLRQASIWGCSLPELEILTRSPYLESLLIRSACIHNHNIDVTSCSRLKLLGVPDYPTIGVVPLGLDHPVEHIWIYWTGYSGNPELFTQLSMKLPKISRITVEIPSSSWRDLQKTDEFRGTRLDTFGLTIRPLATRSSCSPILIIERATMTGVLPTTLNDISASTPTTGLGLPPAQEPQPLHAMVWRMLGW